MQLLHGLAEGQVLQRLGKRGASVLLTGTAEGRGPIFASLSSSDKVVRGWQARPVGRAASGKFAVRLVGIPAGGPYRLTLRLDGGPETAEIDSFFVGDVWLMAGQSNMQGCGNLADAPRPHPLVRVFTLRREWSLAVEPLHFFDESPDSCHFARQCTPEEGKRRRRLLAKGTGVGIFFGKEMVKRTGVPQGFITAAHGGTSMEQWDPDRKALGGASFYGSLLLSVRATGQPVAGVLWYQGESDATPEAVPLYPGRMKDLVMASRRDLKQPRLPWLVVQIARVYGRKTPVENEAWNAIQEAQRLLPEKILHLETVSAIDLPLDDGIHIGTAGFARLGDRLARVADRLVHGNRKEAPAPRLRSTTGLIPLPEGSGAYVDVFFDNVPGGLHSPDEPRGFTVVDAEGNDLRSIFKTTLHGNRARLRMDEPPRDATLRYGHGNLPACNVNDGRGMALPVFGAQPLRRDARFLPFVTRWRKTGIVDDAPPLRSLTVDDLERHPFAAKDYPEDTGSSGSGFINEHEAWRNRSGQNYFATRIEAASDLDLDVLCGYDGPFRLWIDRKPFYSDLDGMNPCLPDQGCKPIRLKKGRHDFHVAVDLADGLTWGFFLRFARRNLSGKKRIPSSFAPLVVLG